MTLYDKRRNKLISNLKDKEYRNAFVEESINVGISFQVKALRKQREWTQEDLGKHSGMYQNRISIMEDPNYSSLTLSTLKDLASAFDVGLMVRFVPFSELVEWEVNLVSGSLEVTSFPQESYFKEKPKEFSPIQYATIKPSNVTEIRTKDLSETASLSVSPPVVLKIATNG